MNLVGLEYFLTNKTKNMDLNALLSEKIETIFFAMTRCSLPYLNGQEYGTSGCNSFDFYSRIYMDSGDKSASYMCVFT